MSAGGTVCCNEQFSDWGQVDSPKYTWMECLDRCQARSDCEYVIWMHGSASNSWCKWDQPWVQPANWYTYGQDPDGKANCKMHTTYVATTTELRWSINCNDDTYRHAAKLTAIAG